MRCKVGDICLVVNDLERPENNGAIVCILRKSDLRRYRPFTKVDWDVKSLSSIHCDDGYELGRELEQSKWWSMDFRTTEALDELSSDVYRAVDKAEKQWAIDNNIQPKLEIGTALKRGVIAGIYGHGGAKYQVKEHGCTHNHRFLLVNFEDAEREAGL